MNNLKVTTLNNDGCKERLYVLDVIYKMVFPFKKYYENIEDLGVNTLFVQALGNFDSKTSTIKILSLSGMNIGYALILNEIENENSSPHLHHISISQKYQRKGYGNFLLKNITDQFENISIEAMSQTEGFFKNNGFYRKQKTSIVSDIVTMHFGPNEEKEYFIKTEVALNSPLWVSYISELKTLFDTYKAIKAS